MSNNIFHVENVAGWNSQEVMQFTLSLSSETAARINKIVKPFGGSVPGYAASWADDISKLPAWEQHELRDILDAKIKRLEETEFSASQHAKKNSGSVPAIA